MMSIRVLFDELQRWQWLGILVGRLAVGLLFFISGRGKVFVSERQQQMQAALREAHVPFPETSAWFVSAVEFVFGLLLMLGALTPLACIMLAGVMAVALATTKIGQIKAASLFDWLGQFLYLPETLYLVILFWLFLSGPGWLSLDHILFSSAKF